MTREETRDNITGIVLAAGKSSRMGDFKPLLPVGGQSMVKRAAAMLRYAGAQRVLVVTGRQAEDIRVHLRDEDVLFVHNPDYASTQMLDSLRLALKELKSGESALVTPVDAAAVSFETALRVSEAEGCFVRPICGGKPGHPVKLSPLAVELVLSYDGEGGLAGAVGALGMPVTEVEVNDPGALLDADTPEQYRLILRAEGEL